MESNTHESCWKSKKSVFKVCINSAKVFCEENSQILFNIISDKSGLSLAWTMIPPVQFAKSAIIGGMSDTGTHMKTQINAQIVTFCL